MWRFVCANRADSDADLRVIYGDLYTRSAAHPDDAADWGGCASR